MVLHIPIDEKDNLRNFSQFKKVALKINKKHNVNWLRAEYQTAVLQGQAAAKWSNFVEDKHRFPNLRYSAVLDSRTRPQHREWHDIIRPVDDSFWDTHYPPNGWNCRCTVTQTTEEWTGVPKKLRPPEKHFTLHAGKTGQIVAQSHPYYTGATKALAQEAKNTAISLLRKQIKPWAKQNLLKKTFQKDGIQMRFSSRSIEKILSQPHDQKYFQLLSLFDFQRVLKKSKPYRIGVPHKKQAGETLRVKTWHYFEIDVFGEPSLINVREDLDGTFTIYTLSQKPKKRK